MSPHWVSSAAQVRGLDRHLIDVVGVPGLALMELAADGLARAIREALWAQALQGVVVVCGGGNNGGDGYVLARRLHGWGVPVHVWSLRTQSNGDAGRARTACERAGVPPTDKLGDCGLIVDAVCGTGLTAAPRPETQTVLDAMARHPAPVLAVDLPSGLCADTGQPLGPCPTAAVTVTFGRWKPGLLCEPGARHAGEVRVHDIGLDTADPEGQQAIGRLIDANSVCKRLPKRAPGSHKGDHGHLLVVAGSTAMAGAAVLACCAAMRTGAGRVTLWIPQGALPRLRELPPEVMVRTLGSGDVLDADQAPSLAGFDALIAGPGLGGGEALPPALIRWLTQAWVAFEGAVVLDADALVCAADTDRPDRVITPHPGEAGRLLNQATASVQSDRFAAVRRLATAGTALLKGRHSLVCTGSGPIAVNPTGNAILATAGSGDVLAGMVASLCTQGLTGHDAACCAAFLHGRCAERLQQRGPGGWTASDVAGVIPAAIADVLSGA